MKSFLIRAAHLVCEILLLLAIGLLALTLCGIACRGQPLDLTRIFT